ncbi:MAG: hypothetical protein IPN26_15945 [Bacteroidetes bacterium]|nr:hypothetical protein [Bacteroidota bacterium]
MLKVDSNGCIDPLNCSPLSAPDWTMDEKPMLVYPNPAGSEIYFEQQSLADKMDGNLYLGYRYKHLYKSNSGTGGSDSFGCFRPASRFISVSGEWHPFQGHEGMIARIRSFIQETLILLPKGIM